MVNATHDFLLKEIHGLESSEEIASAFVPEIYGLGFRTFWFFWKNPMCSGIPAYSTV
jgi:hypothetical protein